MAYVIYLLDDNQEAYDVQWYCSEECRNEALNENNPYQSAGSGNDDFVEGTVCDRCGDPVL